MATGNSELATRATSPINPPLEGRGQPQSTTVLCGPSSKSAERISGRGLGLTVLVLLAAAVSPSHAGWQDNAAPSDVQRLAQLSESRAKGLQEASRAAPSDLAAIQSVLQSGTVSASAGALKGKWRCRMMKLGGLTPAIVYSWFSCRIGDSHGALAFEKLSGSQRTSGTLYPDGQGYVYLGASYVTGEKPHAYSGTGAAAGAAATPDDQIGHLSLLYDGRARLELPYPTQESTFDVIELKR